MVFTTEGFFEVALKSWPEWAHDHGIPFRRSNRMSCQAMSSTPAIWVYYVRNQKDRQCALQVITNGLMINSCSWAHDVRLCCQVSYIMCPNP